MWEMHAFASEKSAFCGQNTLFLAENREQNPQKKGRRGVFSFREMSDVKALARIFLPTPRQMARAGGEIRTPQRAVERAGELRRALSVRDDLDRGPRLRRDLRIVSDTS
jgi:hypothetical protein